MICNQTEPKLWKKCHKTFFFFFGQFFRFFAYFWLKHFCSKSAICKICKNCFSFTIFKYIWSCFQMVKEIFMRNFHNRIGRVVSKVLRTRSTLILSYSDRTKHCEFITPEKPFWLFNREHICRSSP